MVQLILLTVAFCCMTDAYSMDYRLSGRGATHSFGRGGRYSGREVLVAARHTDGPYDPRDNRDPRTRAVLPAEQQRVTKEQLASQLSDMRKELRDVRAQQYGMRTEAAIAEKKLEGQRQAFIALLKEFNDYKVSMAADLAARPTREEIEKILGTMQEIQQLSQQTVDERLNQLQGQVNTFETKHGADLQQIKELCGLPIQKLQQDQHAMQQKIACLSALAGQQQ